MSTCPQCGFQSPSDTECLKCGVVFAKFVAPIPVLPEEKVSKKSKETENRWVVVGAVPGALLFAWLAEKFFLTKIVFEACRLWIHEFGHAFVAWLSGRAATPLGFGWTNFEPNRSMVVFVCFAFLLGVSEWKSIEAKAWALASVIGALFLLQLYFTFSLHEDQVWVLMAYGGVGGEFYLGALLVVAFYFKFPEKVRWDFFRYPILLIGAYSFLNTFRMWIAISHNQAFIPWGSLLFGETDGGGDMNQLFDQAGWTKKEIIQMYVRTGTVCAWAIAAAYVFSFFRLCGGGVALKNSWGRVLPS